VALSDAAPAAGSRAPVPPEGLLEGLPAEVTGQARWRERHIAEVVSGLPAVSRRSQRGAGRLSQTRPVSTILDKRARFAQVCVATVG